ncbi:MAG: class I SAM-dependent methyltransferase [Nitrospirota bacterium]
MAEAIAELFRNNTLRKQLAQSGLEVAREFTREKVLERIERAFETILYKEKLSRTKKAWDSFQTEARNNGRKKHWWDSPVIMEHCQKLVSGDPKINIYQFLKKNFVPAPFSKGLSICSGAGEFERGLIESGICKSVDAYEIAEERVREGIAAAREKNYAIDFFVEDVNSASFKKGAYDAFFSWSALHHILNLEGVCRNVADALKPGGLVAAQEFIGPNQFQWTDKQLEVMNGILTILPERLRTNPATGEVIATLERPTIASMNSTDPSEAIRSGDIIPVLRQFFDIKTIRYFGGSVFNFLFNEIIGNFDHTREEDTSLIRMVLLVEQLLIEHDVLDNDYAVIIAKRS